MSELVRVKERFQVTIPVNVRSAASIQTGDYLEVSAVAEGILLRPKRMVSADRSVRTIVDFLRENHGPGRTKARIDADLGTQRNEW